MMTLIGIFWPLPVAMLLALYTRYNQVPEKKVDWVEEKVKREMLEKYLRPREKEVVVREEVVTEPFQVVPEQQVSAEDEENEVDYRMNIAKDPTDTTWFVSDKHQLPEPSVAEYRIINELQKYNVEWAREISFKGLHFTTYSFPRVDFYLPKYKVVIEYDGKDWHKTKESKSNDKAKDKFCKDNNIRIIRYNTKHYYHLHTHIERLMKELGIKQKSL